MLDCDKGTGSTASGEELPQCYHTSGNAKPLVHALQGQFRGRVYGPILLDVSVPEPQHAKYLETHFASASSLQKKGTILVLSRVYDRVSLGSPTYRCTVYFSYSDMYNNGNKELLCLPETS